MWTRPDYALKGLLSLCAAASPFCVMAGFARGEVPAQSNDPIAETFDIDPAKRVLGATSILVEASTGVELSARIDTGAASCSMHVEEIEVVDGVAAMRKNIGKEARLRIRDADGQDYWIDTKIVETVLIKNPNSDKKQRRYKVWLTLQADGIEKRVLVTLCDRSHLKYPLLIGRNFLNGDFLVDVSLESDS